MENSKEVVDRLKACSATLGQTVRVQTPDGDYDARAVDIAPNGALVVSTAEGEKLVTAGEIIHIR